MRVWLGTTQDGRARIAIEFMGRYALFPTGIVEPLCRMSNCKRGVRAKGCLFSAEVANGGRTSMYAFGFPHPAEGH